MKLLNGKIGVKFDESHNKTLTKGLNDLDIVRADLWINREDDGEQSSKYNENLNYLETKPQIASVTITSASCDYKVGDKIFLHYMAYETAELTEYGWIVDTDFILFQIMPDNTFKMVDGAYLGEQLLTDEVITETGIYLSGGKKEGLKVKITHVPDNNLISIGETVVTVDDKQYELNYWGKKYIKLVENEIVGVLI